MQPGLALRVVRTGARHGAVWCGALRMLEPNTAAIAYHTQSVNLQSNSLKPSIVRDWWHACRLCNQHILQPVSSSMRHLLEKKTAAAKDMAHTIPDQAWHCMALFQRAHPEAMCHLA